MAFATVIDNISGDSVMNSSSYLDEPVIWLPGVVHAPGKNDTLWQTDLWFHNPEPTHDWLASEATYLHGKDIDINYVFEYPDDWPAVEAMGMRRRLGIAGSILDELGLESTSGYMIFEGLEGQNAPQIAARTYTSDDSGGTYGLHLPAFGPKDLLQVGEVGYIVGVSNSADDLRLASERISACSPPTGRRRWRSPSTIPTVLRRPNRGSPRSGLVRASRSTTCSGQIRTR